MIDGILRKILIREPEKVSVIDAEESTSLSKLSELTNRLEQRDRELRAERNLLHQLCDSVPDPMWCKDLSRVYKYANKAFRLVFAPIFYLDSPVVGKTVLEVVAVRGIAVAASEADDLTIESMCTCRFIETFLFPGRDRPRIFDTHRSPWRDNGNVVGIVGTSREITSSVPEEVFDRIASSSLISRKVPLDWSWAYEC